MTSPPPGVTGPVGITTPTTRAPRAWRTLMHTMTRKAPRSLVAADRALARLRRL